jgi:hypothetical protein
MQPALGPEGKGVAVVPLLAEPLAEPELPEAPEPLPLIEAPEVAPDVAPDIAPPVAEPPAATPDEAPDAVPLLGVPALAVPDEGKPPLVAPDATTPLDVPDVVVLPELVPVLVELPELVVPDPCIVPGLGVELQAHSDTARHTPKPIERIATTLSRPGTPNR